jgi:hypothetical protein
MRNVTSFVLKTAAAATLSIAAVATTTATAQAQQLNLVGSVNLNDQPGNPANLFIDFVNNFVLATPSVTGVFTPRSCRSTPPARSTTSWSAPAGWWR